MHSTYAQTQKTAQKKEASTAAAVLDASSQNEGLQRKADMMNNAAQREEAPRPNNTGMPDNLKSGIESLSGFSMDDVRVHYNSSKPATVQALAYTQGTDIHVAPGQEKHLPHEAWHVAQQMAGRVSPTTNINGMPVNDNAALEHEADVMGEKAVQRRQSNSIYSKTTNSSIKIIQCAGAAKQGDHLFNNIPKSMEDLTKGDQCKVLYNQLANTRKKFVVYGISHGAGYVDPNTPAFSNALRNVRKYLQAGDKRTKRLNKSIDDMFNNSFDPQVQALYNGTVPAPREASFEGRKRNVNGDIQKWCGNAARMKEAIKRDGAD